MKMERIAEAYPPRLMRREHAARYLSMSPTQFDKLVKAGTLPAPTRLGGMSLYDRHRLDAAADDLANPEVDEFEKWARENAG
jgi:predicted DNA-binding transcriptional regulator AlpA